jgi:hypothetical protein
MHYSFTLVHVYYYSFRAILRSTFKSFVSMFCPLVLFFITLEGARPHYDRLFKTTIVHHHRLYRPV